MNNGRPYEDIETLRVAGGMFGVMFGLDFTKKKRDKLTSTFLSNMYDIVGKRGITTRDVDSKNDNFIIEKKIFRTNDDAVCTTIIQRPSLAFSPDVAAPGVIQVYSRFGDEIQESGDFDSEYKSLQKLFKDFSRGPVHNLSHLVLSSLRV